MKIHMRGIERRRRAGRGARLYIFARFAELGPRDLRFETPSYRLSANRDCRLCISRLLIAKFFIERCNGDGLRLALAVAGSTGLGKGG